VRYFDGSRRGYLRCELTKDAWRTDARTVDSIEVRESPTRTTASFVVESGRPGLVPA
jgi:alkaline phosphatase D